MKIFNTYTGTAMLNNALMTIEALGSLKHVSDITPETLISLYGDIDLKALNKRFKSYTMLFSKNGPLKNDKKNGDKIYDEIFYHLIQNFENQGNKKCEVSGLYFEKSFDALFKEILKKIGLSDKEIAKKDATVNRVWFPLIGGLGSDAQALPQAKFAVQIHPICIPIMQFLPFSALLYKGGILLIDSSNFEFAREFIAEHVRTVQNRVASTPVNNPIENIKDDTKGTYLLKAINILEDKEEYYEIYSDLNLWSFTNSGTGASCEIDRVPNELIKKLIRLKQNVKIENEVKEILRRNSLTFLDALENNREWYLLYPNVFKKDRYDGVSVDLLEAYFKEINSIQKIEYAKYLAYLIEKYKTDAFSKYLGKTDGHKEKDFHTDLLAVLVKATENGEWDLAHHLEILDDADAIPIQNRFYQILKISHFYHYKKTFNEKIPTLGLKESACLQVCEWLLAFIQQDGRKDSLIADFLSPQKYLTVNFLSVFHRAYQQAGLTIEDIYYACFDKKYQSSFFGINGLLRIFFSQPHQHNIEIRKLETLNGWEMNAQSKKWFSQIRSFVADYQAYYFDKYENKESGLKPYNKFLNLINAISNQHTKFLIWFYEAADNVNQFLRLKRSKEITQEGELSGTDQSLLKEDNKLHADIWSEALLYNPYGEYSPSFARFAIKFSLLKQYQHLYKETKNIIS